jgi:dipeptidase E
MGGGGFMLDPGSPLDDHLLSLSPERRPRVCFVPTPAGDRDPVIAAFFEAFAARDCEPSCLRLWGAPERPADRLADQDVIYVSGGNTANALALWRLHGVDRALGEAWERGAVLGGVSAGANCWFEACTTDSFQLGRADPLLDGLGFVRGSFTPHYDAEPARRPALLHLVTTGGLPAGYACDEFAAVHLIDGEVREAVASRAGARALRVDAVDGAAREALLDVRLLA